MDLCWLIKPKTRLLLQLKALKEVIRYQYIYIYLYTLYCKKIYKNSSHVHPGSTTMDYNSIPHIIYTYPEVAWVGKSEETLRQENIDYKIGKFPNTSNSRARTNLETDGFVKVLADRRTDRILGVHMISSFAGELINEAALAVQCKIKSEQVARTCHAHPVCIVIWSVELSNIDLIIVSFSRHIRKP